MRRARNGPVIPRPSPGAKWFIVPVHPRLDAALGAARFPIADPAEFVASTGSTEESWRVRSLEAGHAAGKPSAENRGCLRSAQVTERFVVQGARALQSGSGRSMRARSSRPALLVGHAWLPGSAIDHR
jgi:hypothetical protein